MKLIHLADLSKRQFSDIVVLPFYCDQDHAIPACPMEEFEKLYQFPIETQDFKGKVEEVVILYNKNKNEKRVALLGLGKKQELSAEVLRRCYASLVKVCHQKHLSQICIALPKIGKGSDFLAPYAIVEGLLLANYSYDQLKSETLSANPTKLIEKIYLSGLDLEEFKLCQKAQTIVNSVHFARDLVNGNAKDVTPQMLSQTALNLANQFKTIKTTILDKKALEKLGMRLLLAVNAGSALDPALILIHYEGHKKGDLTAIVGKGITYDTGGLNLKPTGSMETMKDDMSGAASVLGTLQAAAALQLKVNLLGVIASTENAIGSKSYKPGDVYKSYSGKTVEISNTDAEGRLVLADALSYIQDHYHPKIIIDLATLTGGVVVALGHEATGLFSNSDVLAEALMQSGHITYERLWRLPIYPEYKEALKSQIADIQNCGDRKASAGTAAFFLEQFIKNKETAWAHLDIAGTAYLPKPKYYNSSQATGVGIRLLINFLQNET